MTALFISDLHLQPEREDITLAFEQFLSRIAINADTLYILGDFFEVWVGDDDDSSFNQRILDALKQYTQQGKQLFLMCGNRDFLLGEAFAQACNATLLSDPTLVTLPGGTSALLMHGDSLCTNDREYMAFRAMARSAPWQQELLSKSLEERKFIARQLREKSKSMSSMKAEDIMDVTPADVMTALNEHTCNLMIHGHTHRPDRHPLEREGEPAERIVLGDWDSNAWWLECSDDDTLTLFHRALTEFSPPSP